MFLFKRISTKASWDVRESEEISEEGDSIPNEDLKDAKDKEYIERKIVRGNKIDLAAVRPTDLPISKDLFTLGLAPLKEDIEI